MRTGLQPVAISCNKNFYHGPFAALVDARALSENASDASNGIRKPILCKKRNFVELAFSEVRARIAPVASCTRARDPPGRGSPSERRSMSTEENKTVSNRMAEAIGRADFDAFDELMAPELAQEFKQGIAELRLAFPDYHGTNEIQVAEGDMVASRFVFYGTHRGEFMGVAPTGRRVTIRGLALDKVVDGKIVESIVEVDLEDVLGQIGAVVRAEPSAESEEASPT